MDFGVIAKGILQIDFDLIASGRIAMDHAVK